LNCSASDQNGEIVNVCKRFCFEAVGHSDRISSAVFRIKALPSEMSVPFERTHHLGRLGTALEATGKTLPTTPFPLAELNDFAVVYRYDFVFQCAAPSQTDLKETVRLIPKHIVTRIGALSGTPWPPSATI
jgi:hypothetical protein